MILTKSALAELLSPDVSTDYINPYYVELTVDSFKEFRSGLRIKDNESEVGMEKETQFHNGMWKLDPGTYKVEFEQDIYNLPDFHFGIIMPHDKSIDVGAYPIPRTYTGSGSWCLFHVSKSVDIEEGSPVAITLINRVYNPSGRLNDIERRLTEVEQKSGKGSTEGGQAGGDSSDSEE